MRDEYDKLEGALRKLGVDPDTIVGNHTNVAMASSEDDDDYHEYDSSTSKVRYNKKSSNNNYSSRPPHNSELDPDLYTPFNVVAVPAAGSGDTASTLTTMSLEDSLEPRTGGRLRHLDILEEVSCFLQHSLVFNRSIRRHNIQVIFWVDLSVALSERTSFLLSMYCRRKLLRIRYNSRVDRYIFDAGNEMKIPQQSQLMSPVGYRQSKEMYPRWTSGL